MTVTLLAGLMVAALSQQQFDTTFAVRPGSRIEVETFGGQIRVRTWNRNEVRVQAQHGRRDDIDISVRAASVSIEAEGHMGPATNVQLHVTIPRDASIVASGVQTSIDIEGVAGDVEAETVHGNIRVVGGARVEIESVEGELVVSGARGRVDANTVNRGIQITDVHGDLSLETVNGPIIIRNAQSTVVDAETVNGRIIYEGTLRENGRYSLATHNGEIWLVVPHNTSATVDVSTFNGELDTSFQIPNFGSQRRGSYHFVLGSGKARIDLESFGGDIYLRRPGESVPFGNR